MSFWFPKPATVPAKLLAGAADAGPSRINVPVAPVNVTDPQSADGISRVAPVPIVADPDGLVEVALGPGVIVFALADVDTGGS